MLDNTLSIDYAATTGITLTRVNQDNYSSEYYGETGDMKFKLNVKHTIPARGLAGESHLVRLDVEHYDAEGTYMRTSSAWIVVKTFDSTQDTTAVSATALALQGVTDDATFIGKIAARES